MPSTPKKNEDKMNKVLTAWRTLAADKTFGGMNLAAFQTQVDKSMAPRLRLAEIEDEKTEQLTLRDDEDEVTVSKIELVIAGVIADPDFGSDSALYEAMGYVRKSDRKSGLTRKKKTEEPPPTP